MVTVVRENDRLVDDKSQESLRQGPRRCLLQVQI